MDVVSTPPEIVIANIGDVDSTPDIDMINNNNSNSNNNNNNNNNINNSNNTIGVTDPPLVSLGASVIPPPPSPPTPPVTPITTTPSKAPDDSENTTITTTSTATTTATESASVSSPTTSTATKECPNIFAASRKDFEDEEEEEDVRRDHHQHHHHTIIINNKNKAVVFDHKNRGDDASHKFDEKDVYRNHSYSKLNPRERTPGSIVTAICSHGSVPLTVTFLECQSNGKWNGTLPHCHASLDVSSDTLYFSVIGGVCGLAILVMALLYYLMMKTKRKEKGPVSPPLDPDKAIYVDPYAVGERLYSIPAPVHYTRGDITYAKPQIYSTYLNPSFYEDAYQRWRRQEQQVSEKLYDSPFINTRSPHQWGDNQDPTWTLSRGDKQLDKLQIPRAKISQMDQGSVRSHDSVSTLTFTGHKPQRPVLYGRSTSVVSTNSTMPRYGTGYVPRRQNSLLESPAGLHLVKAFDDVPPPTLQELECEHMPDGRTPF